jgi:hypothetical protein
LASRPRTGRDANDTKPRGGVDPKAAGPADDLDAVDGGAGSDDESRSGTGVWKDEFVVHLWVLKRIGTKVRQQVNNGLLGDMDCLHTYGYLGVQYANLDKSCVLVDTARPCHRWRCCIGKTPEGLRVSPDRNDGVGSSTVDKQEPAYTTATRKLDLKGLVISSERAFNVDQDRSDQLAYTYLVNSHVPQPSK